jgi:hypothetical protein
MAALIERLRSDGRAAPAGKAYGDDVYVICAVRMTGALCPTSAR